MVVLALGSCNLPDQRLANATPNVAQVYTQAAITMAAGYTQQAETSSGGTRRPPPKEALTASASAPAVDPPPAETPLAGMATSSPAPYRPAYSPAASTRIIEAAASAAPTAAPTAGHPCLSMDYVSDVTAPLDTPFLAGSSFIKTWRVRNSGACAWGTDYALVYTGGELIGPVDVVFLPFATAPGGEIDLSVSLFVPVMPGVYGSSWMLRAPDGSMFGSGPNGMTALPVRIRAFQPTYSNQFPFDFSMLVCSAAWRSAAGPLPCPGVVGSPDGEVFFLDTPTLESAPSRQYGLLTRPNRDRQGWIAGEFPAYLVQPGDHFVSELACQSGSQSCNVRFQLQYREANGVVSTLGDWQETYDGRTTPVDVNLSFLSGRSVTFILSVINQGDPRWADAIWLLPRIQKTAPPTEYVLNWTREGYRSRLSCEALRINLVGPRAAIAVAYDCQAGSLEIGRAALSYDQAAQVWNWVQEFRDFEGESYTTLSNRAVQTWLTFRGVGLQDASANDIQSINQFAAQLFQQISR